MATAKLITNITVSLELSQAEAECIRDKLDISAQDVLDNPDDYDLKLNIYNAINQILTNDNYWERDTVGDHLDLKESGA